MPAKLHYNVWAFPVQHLVINATYFLEGNVRPTMSTAVLDDGAGGVALYNLRELAAQQLWNPVAPVVKARCIVIIAIYLLRGRRESYYEHISRQLTFFECVVRTTREGGLQPDEVARRVYREPEWLLGTAARFNTSA